LHVSEIEEVENWIIQVISNCYTYEMKITNRDKTS